MSQAILGTISHKNVGWFKQNKIQLMSGLFLLAMTLSISLPVAVAAQPQGRRRHTNRNRQVTRAEVQQTIQSLPEVMDDSRQTNLQGDADSAVTSIKDGNTVDVPKNAKEGVTFGAENGPKVDIELPNADKAGEGTQVAPGVVAYESDNGAANAVQADKNGGVRMMTIIDNPDAPTDYDYKVTIPNGGSVQLAVNGGAVILDANDQLLSIVDTPWAKDATGKLVETWFTTDGQTLTQHVKHNVPGVAYPVTADPWISWAWHGATIYLSRNETIAIGVGTGIAAGYFAWARIPGAVAQTISWGAAWAGSHGYCLAVYINWWTRQPTLWLHRC